jgi:TP901 family phage tail tape measure protein
MANDSVIRVRVAGTQEVAALNKQLAALHGNFAQLGYALKSFTPVAAQKTASLNRIASSASIVRSSVGGAREMTNQFAGSLGVLGASANLLPGPLTRLAGAVSQLSFAFAIGRSAGLNFASILGRMGIGLGLAAFAGVAGASVRQFSQLEDQLVRTGIAAGKFGDENIRFRAETMRNIRALSEVSGFTFGMDQIAQAGKVLVKAGVDIDEAFAGTNLALLEFARVAEIDVPEASDILVQVSRNLGVSFKTASDLITNTADLTVVEAREIAKALRDAAPAFKQFGVDEKQFGAFIGLLAEGGLRAEAAGTAMRTLAVEVAQLQTGLSAPEREVLERRGLMPLLSQLRAGMVTEFAFLQKLAKSGLTTGELATLFGRRGFRPVDIMQRLGDQLDRINDGLQDMDGFTSRASATISGTLSEAVERLSHRWQAFLASFGDGGAFVSLSQVLVWVIDALVQVGVKIVALVNVVINAIELVWHWMQQGMLGLLKILDPAFGTNYGARQVENYKILEGLHGKLEENLEIVGLGKSALYRDMEARIAASKALDLQVEMNDEMADAIESLKSFSQVLGDIFANQLKSPKDLVSFLQGGMQELMLNMARHMQVMLTRAMLMRDVERQLSAGGLHGSALAKFAKFLPEDMLRSIAGNTFLADLLGSLASAAFVSVGNVLIQAVFKMVDVFTEQMKKATDQLKAHAMRAAVPVRAFGPGFDTGGEVTQDGWAKVHKGEVVLPPAGKAGLPSFGSITIQAPVTVYAKGDAQEITREIGMEFERELERAITKLLGGGIVRREGMEGVA